jgi:hypothetical protein
MKCAIAAIILAFAVPIGAQDAPPSIGLNLDDSASIVIGYDGSLATLKGLRAGFASAPRGFKFTREQLIQMMDKTIDILTKERAEELLHEQKMQQKFPPLYCVPVIGGQTCYYL